MSRGCRLLRIANLIEILDAFIRGRVGVGLENIVCVCSGDVEACLSRCELVVFENVIRDLTLLAKVKASAQRYGHVCSVVPEGFGLALCARSLFNEADVETLVELFLKSRVLGPEPVHLNTVWLLYFISRLLAMTLHSCTLVEIGTGLGVSTLGLVVGLRGSRCRVVTVDVNLGRLELVESVFRKLGLEDYIEFRACDARLGACKEPVDLLFIDGAKEQYMSYVEACERHMVKPALILAHNTVSHPHAMQEFIAWVSARPSTTLMSDPAGLTVTLYA